MIVWIDTGSPVCSCCGSLDSDMRYSLSDSDAALLNYLTQERYTSDAAPLINGKASGVIATAAALLIVDVDVHPQGDTPKGLRARAVLERIAELAGTYSDATWHAT